MVGRKEPSLRSKAVWRARSREFTTHDRHILAILSSLFLVLVGFAQGASFERVLRKRKKING